MNDYCCKYCFIGYNVLPFLHDFLTGYLEFRLYEIINFLYFYITQGFIELNILKMKQNELYKDGLF